MSESKQSQQAVKPSQPSWRSSSAHPCEEVPAR